MSRHVGDTTVPMMSGGEFELETEEQPYAESRTSVGRLQRVDVDGCGPQPFAGFRPHARK